MEDLEVCRRAAIKLADGTLIVGKRHHNCLGEIKDRGLSRIDSTQGFVTNRRRFVDRVEGLVLQHAAGIKSASVGGYTGAELYSEDLY